MKTATAHSFVCRQMKLLQCCFLILYFLKEKQNICCSASIFGGSNNFDQTKVCSVCMINQLFFGVEQQQLQKARKFD